MTDVFSKRKRSWIMSRVKGENTSPELIIRSLVHKLGYRFRLYRKELPGKPDLVFPFRKKVIFINGCFWHGHKCRRGKRKPKTNRIYWSEKIKRNIQRDRVHVKELKKMGWRSLTIWECQIRNIENLKSTINSFLE